MSKQPYLTLHLSDGATGLSAHIAAQPKSTIFLTTSPISAKAVASVFRSRSELSSKTPKIPLQKWLMAIWMLTSHKKGIASTTLVCNIDVTRKTAWFILHRIRHAATTGSFNAPLEGTVEVDETFVGGKEKYKHASKQTPGSQGGAKKAVMLALLERDGELRTEVAPYTKGPTVKGMLRDNVAPEPTLMTD